MVDEVKMCYSRMANQTSFGFSVDVAEGDSFGTNMTDLANVMSSMYCACNNTLALSGYDNDSFVTLPSIWVGVVIYMIFCYIAELELEDIPRVGKAFKIFSLFRAGATADIKEAHAKAICLQEGVQTATSLMENSLAKNMEQAKALALQKFNEQVKSSEDKEAGESYVLQVEEEAGGFWKQRVNSFVLVYNIVAMLIALFSYWGNDWFSTIYN